jgi:hypothetical protein
MLRQNGLHYKFLRIAQEDDGSIYVSIVREEKKQGAMFWDQAAGRFVPDPVPRDGPRRISYHASGRVNYHSVVSSPPLFFEPLFDVSRPNNFLLLSIPSVSRLDLHDGEPAKDPRKSLAVIELPSSASGRLTFLLSVRTVEHVPSAGAHLRLGYDTFALFLTAAPMPLRIGDDMAQHFIHATAGGLFEEQYCGKLEAELAYHQRRVGHQDIIVYGPNGDGVYTLYPAVVMRITPTATFKFRDGNICADVVGGSKPNKIRFRIRGPGGLIKDADLRPLIESIELSAEL